MNESDDLVRGLANMDPFNNAAGAAAAAAAGGVIHPLPSVDGWSSGENQFNPMMDPSGQMYQHQHQQQQQQYRGGGYRGRGGRGGQRGGGGGYRGGRGGGGYYQPQQQQQQQHHHHHNQYQWTNPNLAAALNAGASEFVPKSSLSASANEFVPRNIPNNTSQWAMAMNVMDPLQELEQAVNALQFSPGKFELIAAHLTDVFNSGSLASEDDYKSVVDQLFDASLAEMNFRYTGARLFDHLANHVFMVDASSGLCVPVVKDILLARCTDERNRRQSSVVENPGHFRAFTLFFADLFLQLGQMDEATGEKKRIAVLADYVIELLTTLTNKIDKENVKTISQTLKVSFCL